ncbi:MAG: FAD-dependent oxidoreductase [Rhodospirillales bacterium]|jgi:hypothetical protein|nr:FAD-binding dehydrogenase [Rhodospirillaceae bacterium]MAF48609.1 FAD-binding dehydrogenase [Rhodospirillaceae bacterium]MDP6430182.1 FAD-dependent oxidoreductase [Rhodospirillales bacterium]MDP6642750.1 FAD-dependent oxidoreductase [Rhodospirillales bacterium]MDP6842942.1 FAD-dependent oxidoreductase [Rhodospirillales bacterium]
MARPSDMREYQADVVVVGGGGSGLAAAAEAAKLGGKVIVLEKAPVLGGTTALAVGSIMSSGTDQQRRMKVLDTPEEHAADLEKIARDLKVEDDKVLRDLLTQNVGETVAFLGSIGVQFIGPMEQPPHRHPRLHQIVPSARGYIHLLERRCRKLGAEIHTGVRVSGLILDGQSVTGAEAEDKSGGRVRFLGKNGVILASGDVSANQSLMRDYVGPDLDSFAPFNPQCTGDGQTMALAVGAELVPRRDYGAEGLVQMRFAPPAGVNWIQKLPPSAFLSRVLKLALRVLPGAVLRPFLMKFLTTALGPDRRVFEQGAILVNRDGRRFADELYSGGLHDVGEYQRPSQGEASAPPPNLAIADQPRGEAYIIFDQSFARKFRRWPYFISTAPGIAYAYLDDYRKSRADLFFSGQTLEELASVSGLGLPGLSETIEVVNRSRLDSAKRIAEAPFYALGPLNAWIFTAQVGINVNAKLQALDAAGQAIPGLYAAGSAGVGGFCSTGHGHSLAWAFTSGRLAGRNAMASDG